MSRVRPPYLSVRNGTFYLRVRVPRDLIDQVGVLEIRRSLRVGRLSEARLLGQTYSERLKEVFVVLRGQDLRGGEAIALVRRCFVDLEREVGTGFVPQTDWPAQERGEQMEHSQADLADLEAQIQARRFDDPVVRRARRCAARVGLDLQQTHLDGRDDLLIGIVRALAEQQRLFQHRLTEALLPARPHDRLFESVVDCKTQSSPILPAEPWARVEAQPLGPSMRELADRYLKAKRGRWTAKTLNTNTAKIEFVVEHLGAGTPAASVSPADVRGYRDAVLRLRTNHHLGAGRSFTARQTHSVESRIKPKTALLIFETCKAMFKWAKAEGYIVSNPALDISLDLPKASKGKKPRRPFTPDEVVTLFTSPVFTGCKSFHRRLEPGSVVAHDAYFWVPILAFYTGMRLGELVQLHKVDVHLDGAVPYIDVTEDNGGELGTGEEKHVKSEAGVRRVPLHPDVMALGFEAFVNLRRKTHKGKVRLFWEIGYGADGQPSSLFSKWFARLLDKIGLDDPALVFHSFRHGVEDAFRNNLTPPYVIDRVIGHADGAVSSQYGQGVSLEVAYEAVKGLKLGVSIPDLVSGTGV